jgi:hypothetical protein
MNIEFDRSQQEQHSIDSELEQALSNFGSHTIQNQQPDPKQLRTNIVPIDPSIADSNDKDASTDFARSTAQAAVRSSQKQSSSINKVSKPRVNKPGQKFGAKKKSWVWNWFIQSEEDCNLATCDACGKMIKRLASDKGSPKKLGEHLRTHKIDKNSTNPRRDGHNGMIVHSEEGQRHYYNTLNTSHVTYKVHPLSHEATGATEQGVQGGETVPGLDVSEFDQQPYSQAKFQKQIMRFLVENKLPLSVVKSSTFRQVIYTLKPSAIPDLNELNHLYSSLLEVIDNEKDDDVENKNVDVENNENANVDEQLTNASAEGWDV